MHTALFTITVPNVNLKDFNIAVHYVFHIYCITLSSKILRLILVYLVNICILRMSMCSQIAIITKFTSG